MATASGVFLNGTYKLHQLAHINDGRYGNSWSWISNEVGRGWVQIELREPTLIDRVVWARDREGAFQDRLPVSYMIETGLEPGKWRTVATSDDRRPYDPQAKPEAIEAPQMPPDDAAEFKSVDARISAAKERLAKLQPPLVYVGTFTQPSEPTYRLNRGDPMLRQEEVRPGAIAAVGKPLEVPSNAPEAKRRLDLARWIADPANPLTARVMVNRIWQLPFRPGAGANPQRFWFQRRPAFASRVARLAGHRIHG